MGDADHGALRIASAHAAGLLSHRQFVVAHARYSAAWRRFLVFHDDKIVLDRFAQGIIRRKVRLLVGRAGFTKQDRQDLEQELLLRLLQSLHLFDTDQAHRNVFVTTVIERAVAMILRERLAKKRASGSVQSLDHACENAGDSTEPVDLRRNHEDRVDLTTELAEVLAKLPDDLRTLAERLKSQSLSQAARDLGIPRSTLQCQVQWLRRHLEDAGLRIYL